MEVAYHRYLSLINKHVTHQEEPTESQWEAFLEPSTANGEIAVFHKGKKQKIFAANNAICEVTSLAVYEEEATTAVAAFIGQTITGYASEIIAADENFSLSHFLRFLVFLLGFLFGCYYRCFFCADGEMEIEDGDLDLQDGELEIEDINIP